MINNLLWSGRLMQHCRHLVGHLDTWLWLWSVRYSCCHSPQYVLLFCIHSTSDLTCYWPSQLAGSFQTWSLGGGWPFQDVDDASSLTIVIVQAKLFVVHVIQHTLTLFILPAWQLLLVKWQTSANNTSSTPLTGKPDIINGFAGLFQLSTSSCPEHVCRCLCVCVQTHYHTECLTAS